MTTAEPETCRWCDHPVSVHRTGKTAMMFNRDEQVTVSICTEPECRCTRGPR